MTNFDHFTNEDNRISGTNKTNALLNLINNHPDIDEAKYQCLINKREKVGLDHFNDPKTFIEFSTAMRDVYQNIEEYNLGRKR